MLLASLSVRRLRGGLVMALPVLGVLVLWMMATPARDAAAPMTYQTIWLPVHMVLGKLFLGLVVLALGVCTVVLAARMANRSARTWTCSGATWSDPGARAEPARFPAAR